MRRRLPISLGAAAFSAVLLAACASAPPAPSPMEDVAKPALDRVLGRLVSKGDWDKAAKMSDSVMAGKDPAEREIAVYWKAVALLYRDEPDSATAVLEAQKGKWSAGLRRVHAALLLKLARESGAARTASQWRAEDAHKPPVADKVLQDRVEFLQKESSDLRAENQRLETEKEKYQNLLKDLETIR